MTRRAESMMSLKSWDEQPFSEVEGGPKLARADIAIAYTGAIDGEGTLSYLMTYHSDEDVRSVGLERVSGRLDGRSGSFVVQHDCVLEDGAAIDTITVVPGSATGELAGLRGAGRFVWEHGEDGRLTLDYDFAEPDA
jgi:hypothetical protein